MVDTIWQTIQQYLNTNHFAEMSVVVLMIIVIVWLVRMVKQPVIVWYVLAWIILGPEVLNVVTSEYAFASFGHIWVSLLIFLVGMWLNPKIIKELWPVALVWGISKICIISFLWFFLAQRLWFWWAESLFLWLSLSFSSTIVVVKLLSDTWENTALYGKIVLAILLVQDVLAMIALMRIWTLWVTDGEHMGVLLLSFAKAATLLVWIYCIGNYILPKLTQKIAQSEEYLFIFSFGWCLAISTLFDIAGFPMEIWALAAWVALASSPFKHIIISKLKAVRDLFIAIFFFYLGEQIRFGPLIWQRSTILIFSVFILIIRPLIIMIIMGSMYYKKKNFFLTWITLSQVSEFAPIIIALWLTTWILTNTLLLSIVTSVSLITMIWSHYLYTNKNNLYKVSKKYLWRCERRGHKKEDLHKKYRTTSWPDVIIFGYGNIWEKIEKVIKQQSKSYLIIDADPEAIRQLEEKDVWCMHGDANEVDLFDPENVDIRNVWLIISTIHDYDGSMTIINTFK